MIKTKSTEEPASTRDGLRLFITRYWPRGHNKEECDEWLPCLAPSQELLAQISTDEITWGAFERAYKTEMLKGIADESSKNPRMQNLGQKYFLRLLKRIACDKTITLICTCPPNAKHCHRYTLQKLLSKPI